MKDLYTTFTKDDLWLIKEIDWAKDLQNIREVQFAQGNGYIGSKGILESIPYNAMPGTFISGLYDKVGSQVDELINLPNPVNFRITVEGQKLDEVAMDIADHKRALNMKKGLLVRHTVFRDRKKRHYDYQSVRFISMHNKHIGCMQISLTALDEDYTVDINTGIDTSVTNAAILSEGRKKHFKVRELGQQKNAGYLAIETFAKTHTIIYWSGFYYQINGKKVFAKDNVFQMKLKKNQTVTFTKTFYIKHFPSKTQLNKAKKQTYIAFENVFLKNFTTLLNEHLNAWDKIWKKVNIVISGTANIQQNLRFNIYHMMICAPDDKGFSSIGARTLSAEGYRGHVFWDTEIFILPFFLFNYPKIAKNMLLYRYKRLEQARKLAQKNGYAGAMFPWESAYHGTEETPEWARDIDGKITRVHTHEMEHHLTADIAYATYKYYLATEDTAFMNKYGYEILFETARFWASRVKYNEKKKSYEILNVIGPDEFHMHVNNNYFTNMMAKWNLLIAYRMCKTLKQSNIKNFTLLIDKLNLSKKEVACWKKIATWMSVKPSNDGLIEQFDGYLKLKEVTLGETDENGIPLIPAKWKSKDIALSQLVKQADVLMLIYLLDSVFSSKTKLANYNFYIDRTVHSSSLSPSIHSIIAADVGDTQKAYNLFNLALRSDISNIYGNTHEGIHAASLGGTWQAAVFGFGGVKINKEKLSISPNLPNTWGNMQFSLNWKSCILHFNLSNNSVKVKMSSNNNKELDLVIFGQNVTIKPKKWFTQQRKVLKRTRERYYY